MAYDLDADLRAALEDDARLVRTEIGPPDLIAISGDIAFSGTQTEYEIAWHWLSQTLCVPDCLACGTDRILCIPGNHDVDRSRIEDRPSIAAAHSQLRGDPDSSHDARIGSYLKEPEIFYHAIEHYNRFAAQFNCDISAASPTWQVRAALNDGSNLVVHGLNSTLVSSAADSKDTASGKLILGTHQLAAMRERPGTVALSMCHHPPDWLRNADALETMFRSRARIQLFGHKHAIRLTQVDQSLVVSAGAVHPSRSEVDWQPRYNWLCLRIDNGGEGRSLVVDVYPRQWHAASQSFGPDYNLCSGSKYRRFKLPLQEWSKTSAASAPAPPETSAAAPSTVDRGSVMDRERQLAHRFLTLPYVTRLRIATELGLISEQDEGQADRERNRRYLARAIERQLLHKLWDAVEASHGRGGDASNPFLT